MPGGSGPIFTFGSGGGGGVASSVLLTRPYTAGVAVRDAVYQKADGTVDRALATGDVTSRVLGIVDLLDAPVAGQCRVVSMGDVPGFVGLTAGKRYILGTAPGSIVAEDDTGNPIYPVTTPGSGDVLIEVGLAASAVKLYADIGDPIIL